jgi:acetolactate synthase I/II/III large subunit
MSVSDFVAKFFIQRGVTTVFEVAGGMVAPLLDSFGRNEAIRVVTVHHEQSGAFAADAYARCSGKPAVAIGTAGPGALNLITGIATSYYDSVPVIFLTGNVQTYLQAKTKPVRQFGLQETNFIEVAKPIAKGVFAPATAAAVPQALHDAYELCLEGRPGPVVVEMAFDLQIASEPEPHQATTREIAVSAHVPVDQIVDALRAAERPLIHAGAGIRRAGMAKVFRELIDQLHVPVTTSILGKDLIPSAHPLCLGMPGTYGLRCANLAMVEADFVLVLGSRLDQGQIGADPGGWAANKKVIHIDCDEGEIAARVKRSEKIVVNLAQFLPTLATAVMGINAATSADWLERVAELKQSFPDTDELAGCPGINPNAFLRALSIASQSATAFTVDAGEHTWWTAQSLQLTESQYFVASTGLWSMGTALPAAIGAAIATGGTAVAIAGDGAIQMNLQELQTVVRNRLPVKIIVLNNQCLGMVRQFQNAVLDGRNFSTVIGYDTPDFCKVAEAFGIPARILSHTEDIDELVKWFWEEPDSPSFLEVRLDGNVPVMPQVGFGQRLHQMESYSHASDNNK